MTTGGNTAGRGRVLLLIVLSGAVAVLAGPLFHRGPLAWAEDAPKPQSSFRLVGTIEGGPFTGAVIDDTKNPQAFYRLNEKLSDESQIVKVQSDHIVLKWPDGTKTELYITPGGGGAGGGAAPAAAAVVAPSILQRQAAQPAPEQSADQSQSRSRAAKFRTNLPPDGREGAAGRRPSRMDRKNPDQQGAGVQVQQDPNARAGGAAGRRFRPRPTEGN